MPTHVGTKPRQSSPSTVRSAPLLSPLQRLPLPPIVQACPTPALLSCFAADNPFIYLGAFCLQSCDRCGGELRFSTGCSPACSACSPAPAAQLHPRSHTASFALRTLLLPAHGLSTLLAHIPLISSCLLQMLPHPCPRPLAPCSRVRGQAAHPHLCLLPGAVQHYRGGGGPLLPAHLRPLRRRRCRRRGRSVASGRPGPGKRPGAGGCRCRRSPPRASHALMDCEALQQAGRTPFDAASARIASSGHALNRSPIVFLHSQPARNTC